MDQEHKFGAMVAATKPGPGQGQSAIAKPETRKYKYLLLNHVNKLNVINYMK